MNMTMRILLKNTFRDSIAKPKEDVPRYEWAVGQWAGFALAWLAHRANDRGDNHTFNHMAAAVYTGNTEDCDPTCILQGHKRSPRKAAETLIYAENQKARRRAGLN